MTFLGDDFRRRAEENNKTAVELFGAADFGANPKTRASAVIAKLTANMLYVMGEVVDYLRMSEATDATSVRRRQRAEQTEAIRKAYIAGMASGDYTNYDRLIAEFGASFGEPETDDG